MEIVMKMKNLASMVAIAITAVMVPPGYAGNLIVAPATPVVTATASSTSTAAVAAAMSATTAASKAELAAKPASLTKTWQVEVRDVTLANTFTRWAEAAGQKVRWDVDKNVLVEAPDTLSGTLEEVITAVLSSSGISHGPLPLEVCFYTNNPPLARITRRGEQECK
jgi:Toxin co-regulated pilus biosynthesis protein Q